MDLRRRGLGPSLHRGRLIAFGLIGLRLLLVSLLVVGAVVTLTQAATHRGGLAPYGFDFHGGIWHAGRAVVAGRSPYSAPDPRLLAQAGNAYIPPPPLAELFIPLSVLPLWLAVILLNLVCVAAMAVALRLLGVRSRQVYLLCLCSAPFVFALRYGDPDAIYVLLAALAWCYRDRARGACAVGSLIAAKLVLWPLVIWLVATRRFREAAIAVVSALGLLVTSWAIIGFHGLLQYPRLLGADAQVQSTNHSLLALIRRLGVSGWPASLLAVALAAAIGATIVRAGRGRDHAWFAAAVTFGLFSSAVMFPNYFVILYVPLAITHRRAAGAWFLLVMFSLELHGAPELWLELSLATAIALLAARGQRDDVPRDHPVLARAAPGPAAPQVAQLRS
jgi:hypothetical protein